MGYRGYRRESHTGDRPKGLGWLGVSSTPPEPSLPTVPTAGSLHGRSVSHIAPRHFSGPAPRRPPAAARAAVRPESAMIKADVLEAKALLDGGDAAACEALLRKGTEASWAALDAEALAAASRLAEALEMPRLALLLAVLRDPDAAPLRPMAEETLRVDRGDALALGVLSLSLAGRGEPAKALKIGSLGFSALDREAAAERPKAPASRAVREALLALSWCAAQEALGLEGLSSAECSHLLRRAAAALSGLRRRGGCGLAERASACEGSTLPLLRLRALVRSRRYAKGLQECEALRAAGPLRSAALLLEAECLRGLGRPLEALRSAESAGEGLGPAREALILSLRYATAAEAAERAAILAEAKARCDAGPHWSLHLCCAGLYRSAGGSFLEEKGGKGGEGHVAQLLLCLKGNAMCGEAYGLLGLWYLQYGSDPERAERCLRKAVDCDPLDERSGRALCMLYASREQTTLAKVLLRDTIKRDRGATWALFLLGALVLSSAPSAPPAERPALLEAAQQHLAAAADGSAPEKISNQLCAGIFFLNAGPGRTRGPALLALADAQLAADRPRAALKALRDGLAMPGCSAVLQHRMRRREAEALLRLEDVEGALEAVLAARAMGLGASAALLAEVNISEPLIRWMESVCRLRLAGQMIVQQRFSRAVEEVAGGLRALGADLLEREGAPCLYKAAGDLCAVLNDVPIRFMGVTALWRALRLGQDCYAAALAAAPGGPAAAAAACDLAAMQLFRRRLLDSINGEGSGLPLGPPIGIAQLNGGSSLGDLLRQRFPGICGPGGDGFGDRRATVKEPGDRYAYSGAQVETLDDRSGSPKAKVRGGAGGPGDSGGTVDSRGDRSGEADSKLDPRPDRSAPGEPSVDSQGDRSAPPKAKFGPGPPDFCAAFGSEGRCPFPTGPETRKLLLGALEADPLSARAFLLLGLCASDDALSQHCFLRAVELDRLPSAWANLSVLYTIAGRDDRAERALSGLRAVADHPVMWVLTAVAAAREAARAAETSPYEAIAQLDKAVDAFEAALRVVWHPDALLGACAARLSAHRLRLKCRAAGTRGPAAHFGNFSKFSKFSNSRRAAAAGGGALRQRDASLAVLATHCRPFDARAHAVAAQTAEAVGLFGLAAALYRRTGDLCAPVKNFKLQKYLRDGCDAAASRCAAAAVPRPRGGEGAAEAAAMARRLVRQWDVEGMRDVLRLVDDVSDPVLWLIKAICGEEPEAVTSRTEALIALVNRPFRFAQLERMGVEAVRRLLMAYYCKVQRPKASRALLRREAARLVHQAPFAAPAWRAAAVVLQHCATRRAAGAAARALGHALSEGVCGAEERAEALFLEGTAAGEGGAKLLARAALVDPRGWARRRAEAAR